MYILWYSRIWVANCKYRRYFFVLKLENAKITRWIQTRLQSSPKKNGPITERYLEATPFIVSAKNFPEMFLNMFHTKREIFPHFFICKTKILIIFEFYKLHNSLQIWRFKFYSYFNNHIFFRIECHHHYDDNKNTSAY